MRSINIIAVETQTSGNLGALARLCSNFQVDKLILVRPQCSINEKALRRAIDGKMYLDEHIRLKSLNEARNHVDYLIALTGVPASDSMVRNPIPIFEVAGKIAEYSGSIGLVLGPENAGLSNEDLMTCDISAIIPLLPEEKGRRILNISHATSIALYEVSRIKLMKHSREKKGELITSRQKDQIMEYYDNIAHNSWISKKNMNVSRILFDSVLGRAMLTKKEAFKFLGILRGIYQALTKEED